MQRISESFDIRDAFTIGFVVSIYDKLTVADLVAPFLECFASEFFILVRLLIVLVALVLSVCHCIDISVVKVLAER